VAFNGGMVGGFLRVGITCGGRAVSSRQLHARPDVSSRWFDRTSRRATTRFIGRLLRAFNEWFEERHRDYERLLGWCLRHRIRVLACRRPFVLAWR